YNSNFVVYNTNCCTIGLGNNFLQSDVAIAALDTPAVGIPTWTMLFSALTAPAHATITGYGDNGTGTTGQGTIDFKRRTAENIVSLLGSLDDQDTFLFGAPDGLPANLYMMDFNDPKFNTAQANVFDFNIFHDVALPKEGITAPGDSGGPLIIDHQFSAPTIAAVLSGGDRFFNAQKGAGYGTTSFYQPLYLYWDWIVANSPYKYVGNKAGDGSWTDASHWQMNLDPAYMTIDANGNLVNALPTTPAQGQTNVAPGFGEVCYFDDCVNIVTGVHTNPTPPATPGPTAVTGPFGGMLGQAGFDALMDQYVSARNGTGSSLVGGGPEQVSASLIDGYDPAIAGSSGSILSGQTSAQSDWTNPEGSVTIGGVSVQGAPGSALGQAPNDTAGNAATGIPARYYDVTLAAAGNTTLSGASITVDRLTINGPSAALTIAASGHLTSLIDTKMFAGTMQVDGTYNSTGDFSLFGGLLSGSGTVTAPNTISVLGMIAPGTNGTVGTLTLNSNLVMSSGTTFIADIAPGTSDKLAVTGAASIGGLLAASFAAGSYTIGTQYALIVSTGTLSGTFSSAVFMNTPRGTLANLSYGAHDVFLTLAPAPFVWGATPASGDWNTANNWQYQMVPGASDDANFAASTVTAISIAAPSAAKSLQFNTGAPAYSFAITGSAGSPASLSLTNGIVNNSGNAPTFTVSGISGAAGILAFTGTGNAANSTITAGAFGTVGFTGTADAGAAAVLIAQSGGTIDFSGSTGAAADNKVSAGSIAGAGNFILGADALTVGALNTSTEVSGVISGTGSLTKTGTGVLILSGNDTYTGGTTISGGTLQVGKGAASGIIAGNVVDNGSLIFNRSDSGAFTGVISGTGSFAQNGTGNLTLTATSSYTGATTVNAGILTVNGSIASSTVSVLAGGQLAGSGRVGSTTIASGATLAPGTNGTIGTLTVSGNLTLSSGSNFLADIASGSSDKLVVSGTLATAGTLTLSSVAGYAPHYGDTGVLATASSVTGSFATVTDNITGVLRPTVSVVGAAGNQSLVYTITAASFFTQFTSSSTDQTTIATVLDGARAAHATDLKALYDAIDPLTGSALNQAFENLAPDAERAVGMIDQVIGANYFDMVRERLNDVHHGSGGGGTPSAFHIDGMGLGQAMNSITSVSNGARSFMSLGSQLANGSSDNSSFAGLSGTASGGGSDTWLAMPDGVGGFLTGRALGGTVAIGGSASKADIRGYLIGGGLDFAVGDNLIVGGSVAIGEINTTLRASPATVKSNFAEGGIYGRYDTASNLFVTGFASIGGDTVKTQRVAVVGATSFALSGETHSDTPAFGVTLGKTYTAASDWDDLPWTLVPSVGLQYQHTGVNAFTETGGAAAMAFQEFNSASPITRVAVDIKKSIDLSGLLVTPSVHLGWLNELGGSNGVVNASFASVPTSVMGFANAPLSRDYGEIGAGVDIDMTKTLGSPGVLSVRYDANFGRSDLSYGAWVGQLKVAF
ncbi:MAG: hypothetical protein JWL71_5201, partial [Acidobacteria bacterium]|nr:hypothetical protein [Acidobacteriota bacterium]